MVERRIIVDRLKLGYKGLFKAEEVYKMVDKYFRERAYTKHELKNYEQVSPEGKTVTVIKEPYRKITDYAKYVVRVTIKMNDVKEVVVEKDGVKVKMNTGNIDLIFDGFLELDYEKRWENKPMFYFLRALFDQFVFKVHTEKYEAGLSEETHMLRNQLRAFLNLYRY